ncbi:TIGR00268 family protein [candidate division WOR-1 bacterium RIFOXYB2_FULL_48_7]|uniref:TIGR00268 family protein n=1 Tax=candidate division WOR-1 bacterium RIFOXYB2_FULL_48_7 TaxID=1802583 RepID=A0A1F4TFC4_UNCSA|nr:MAG: TIGR00268 family protein [candidate division WOR-1 bacterium RIFOXYB2_FULL_48_7]
MSAAGYRGAFLKRLAEVLTPLKKVVVAYSGGVDSTFLLFAAKESLGRENVVAVIAQSPTYPGQEIAEAIKYADGLGVTTRLIDTEEFSDENFLTNSRERCYFCKKELFSKLRLIAQEYGISHIVDGSNFDDLADFRPGKRAGEELGVKSPLVQAGLSKAEIRRLSKEAGLPTWNKASMACLASRIPYGTRIDEAILNMVGEGENFLKGLGFGQTRVRHHQSIARIELHKDELPRVMEQGLMDAIVKKFEELGYTYVTIDLKGYRTGSMNEGPPEAEI